MAVSVHRCICMPSYITIGYHQSEEELIANMRKTTRYEIRKAEKIGIQITISKKKN